MDDSDSPTIESKLPYRSFSPDLSRDSFGTRLKGPDGLARVFYCVLRDRRIVMLHFFVKKSAKTPSKELALARDRLRKRQ